MVTRFSERKIFRSSIHLHIGRSKTRSIEEGSGSLEFHLDPNSKKLIPVSSKDSAKDRAPEFIVKPRREYTNEGETAKFRASFKGTSDTELTWCANGKPIISDGRNKLYIENDCHMLEICNVQVSDQGTYVCKIANSVGSAVAETELEVFVRPEQKKEKTSTFVAPTVDIGLEDTEFVEREKEATLVCKFHNATDAKAVWFKDNKELGKWQATASFDGRTAKLVMREASRRVCGVYECVVRNSGGEAKTRCLVSLLDSSVMPIPPKFLQPLFDQTIEEGEKLVLEAEVTGLPKPMLTWYKDKMELESGGDIRIDFKGGRGRLIVDHLGQTDALKFSCVAENIAGEKTTMATVTVTGSAELREPPIFTKELRDMEVQDGDRVELSVEVQGSPPIDIVWVHNNREIPATDPVCRMVNEGNVRKLVIPEVFPEDSGEYVCEAYNEFGDTDTFCRLTVNEVLDKETVPEVNHCCPEFVKCPVKVHATTGTSAILKCRVSGEPPPSVFWSKGTGTIKQGNRYKISSNGDDWHFLEILNCVLEDSGQYTCNLSNTSGTVSATCEIIVQEITHPSSETTDFRSVLKKRSQKPEEDNTTSNTELRKRNSDPSLLKPEGLKLFNGHLKQNSSPKLTVEEKKKGAVNQIDFRGVLKNKAKVTGNSSGLNSSFSDSSGDSDRLLKDSVVLKSGYNSKSQFSQSFPSNQSNITWSKNNSKKQDLNNSESQIHGDSTIVTPKSSRFLHKRDETADEVKTISRINKSHTELASKKHNLVSHTAFNSVKQGEFDRKNLTPHKIDRHNLKDLSSSKHFRDTDSSKLNGSLKGLSSSKLFRDSDSEKVNGSLKGLSSSKHFRDTDSNKVNGSVTTGLSQKRQLFENLDSKAKEIPPKSVPSLHGRPAGTTSGNKVNQVLKKLENSTKENDFQPESKISLKNRREHSANLSLSIADRTSRFKSPEKMDFSKSERKFTKTHSFEGPKSEFHEKYISRGKSVEIPKISQVNKYRINEEEKQSKDTKTNTTSTRVIIDQSNSNKLGDAKPKFETQLEDQTVTHGSEVILECGVTGAPAPEISWAVNDTEVKQSKFFKMSYHDRIARLVIAEVFSEDEGAYACIANNTAGTSSTTCKLTVHKDKTPENSDSEELEEPFSPTATPPKIYNVSPTDFCIRRGGTIEFKASYTSVPPGKVTWCKNKQEITSGGRMCTETGEHFSTLTVTNIQSLDAGQYHVRVENALGVDISNAWLTVEDVPEPPVGQPWVSEVTLTSATLSWSGPAYDGGCPITNYRVEICDAEEQEWTCVSNSCVSTSFRIEDLVPLTPYFFRIFAENKHGVSEPCQTSDVTVTKETRPSMTLRSMSVESDDVFTHDYNDVCTPLSDYNEVCTPMSEYGIVSPLSPDEIPFEHREVLVQSGRKFEQFYDCKGEIGKGKFGYVYKCIEKSTGQPWAAKILKCRESEKHKIQMEVDIMNQLKHPKILMLWDVFEAPRKMILVMELIGGGELFERVLDDDFELTERDCIQFLRQILDAVDYMHNRNILHLDLKPENILCIKDESNKVKIIDFGLARFYQPGENVRVLFGTPEFIAPEVVNYDEIGFTTDMWSIGVVCYVLLTGLSPFMGDNDAETLANVTQGDFDFDDESFDNVSDDGKQFIEQLLVKNKRKRLTSKQALDHRWLAEDAARLKTRKINTKNLKRFMARRKWQKTGNAIRALGRMTSKQKFSRLQNTSSANNSLTDSPISSSSSTLTLGSQGTIIEDKPVTTSFKVSDAEDSLPLNGSTDSGGQTISSNGSSIDNINPNGISKPIKDINSNVDTLNTTNCAFSNLKISSNDNSDTMPNQKIGKESRVISANSHEKSEANAKVTQTMNLDNHNNKCKCPEFTKEMVESKAFPGDSVRFDVAFLGNYSDTSVTWYLEDDVILEGPRHYIQESVEGSCSLIIKDICEDDDGEYVCKIQSKYGEDTCSAELIVYGAI